MLYPWVVNQVYLLDNVASPLLLTCFGVHEARLENSLLKALEANFIQHCEGNFGHLALEGCTEQGMVVDGNGEDILYEE